MFRNRNPGHPSHSYSPSLDSNLFLNQSSDASVQQLNLHHNFHELSVRSENKVRFLSSHPLGDTVLQFSSSRKKKLKNKRYRGQDKKLVDQKAPGIGNSVDISEELKKVSQNFTCYEGYKEDSQYCRVVLSQNQNKMGIQTVKRGGDGSTTSHQNWAQSLSSQSQFNGFEFRKKENNSDDLNKIQQNQEFGNLKPRFELVQSYQKQGQSIMMARTKAPTKISDNFLKIGIKENLQNSNNIITLTKLTKERKRRCTQFQEDLANVQTNKKIQKLLWRESQYKINTKNKLHLQYSSDDINNQMNEGDIQNRPEFSNSSKENHFPCTFPFCQHEKEHVSEEDKLETRIGLRTRIQNVKPNEVFNISEINNELDLGLKIIDDSFEISGVDESGRVDPWVNISMLHTKNSNIFNGQGNKNHILVQDVVLDESLVSPQCHKLKEHLNSVLASRQQTETKGRRPNEFESSDWGEDNILQKMPVLARPSFIHKSSLMSSEDNLRTPCKQEAVIISSNKDLIVHDMGLVFECDSYTILNPMQSMGRIQSILDRIMECKSNRNIVSLYHYQLRYLQEERVAEIVMFKQPTLPQLYPIVHSCQQMIEAKIDIKISQNNFKGLVRDLLFAFCYCSKICNLKIELADIYFYKDHGCDCLIKVDPTNISSCLQQQSNSLDQHNISTIMQVISHFNKKTELSCLNKKMYMNLMEMIEEGLSLCDNEGQRQLNHGELKIKDMMQEVLLHPFLVFHCCDTYSEQIMNFLY